MEAHVLQPGEVASQFTTLAQRAVSVRDGYVHDDGDRVSQVLFSEALYDQHSDTPLRIVTVSDNMRALVRGGLPYVCVCVCVCV